MKLARLTMALLVSAALSGSGAALGQNFLAMGDYDAGGVVPAGGFAMASQFEGGYATQVAAQMPIMAGGGGPMMQPGGGMMMQGGPMMQPAGYAAGGYMVEGGYGAPQGYGGYESGGGVAPPPPPTRCNYYIRLEEWFLRRDRTDTVNFASLGPQGSIVLDTDDFDFEHEGVSSFAVGIPICHCYTLELSYFGLQEWESTAIETSGGNQLFSVYSDFGADPPGGFAETDQSSLQAISYDSSLHNGEINFLHNGTLCCHPIYVLVGVRYVRVEEQFEYDTIAAGGESHSTVETENDLVGFQMGVGMRHCCGDCCCIDDCSCCLSCLKCLSFEGSAKAGVFVNLADQQSTVLTGNDLFAEERNDDNVAFVGQTGVNVCYSPSCCFSIRTGYQVFFVDGLALAPENFNRTAPSTGTRRPVLRDNGSILYHGPSVGVEFHW